PRLSLTGTRAAATLTPMTRAALAAALAAVLAGCVPASVQQGGVVESIRAYAGVNSLSFSPDGKRLAAGADDGVVRVWRLPEGELVRELTGHSEGVYAVVFSPDGKTLASGSYDKSVRLWDAESGRLIAAYQG